MTIPPKPPPFRKAVVNKAPDSPEALFVSLTGKAKTHAYLRGPQQDVLRDYFNIAKAKPNIAFELPMGTGKTGVGLLVAEWRRLSSRRPVAYVSITNQLAKQVIREAQNFGVAVADLCGDKDRREQSAVGRYKTAEAVAVTTYANLFNINPVLAGAHTLILDDAHSGEVNAAQTWSVRVTQSEHDSLYEDLFISLNPCLTAAQVRRLQNPADAQAVEMADLAAHPASLVALTSLLDNAKRRDVKFPWSLLRGNLHACVVLLSAGAIVIRPLSPPTHTHDAFAAAEQRIYLSATIGSDIDICRGYGIDSLTTLRAKNVQEGRRFIFVPEMFTDQNVARDVVRKIWEAVHPRRAVLLAPSGPLLNSNYNGIFDNAMPPVQRRISSADIEESIEPFTQVDDAVLTLAGRYDGLDLPDDDCRLLIMAESPRTVGELETHLAENWKQDTFARARETLRIIQGLGRCTRSATDYAVIVFLGQTLVNASWNPNVRNALPNTIAAELGWGIEQSKTAETAPDDLVAMAAALLTDSVYRDQAEHDIRAFPCDPHQMSGATPLDRDALWEVQFAREMWDGNFDGAYHTARGAADRLSGDANRAVRTWAHYLAAWAAGQSGNANAETTSLERALKCGVNKGWLASVIASRRQMYVGELPTTNSPANSEYIWRRIETLGWIGPRFEQHLRRMLSLIADDAHAAFHEGVDLLGGFLGYEVTRIGDAGAPDIVWELDSHEFFAFEAKTEKKPSGSVLSKRDVLQASGHRNWVEKVLSGDNTDITVHPIIVAPPSCIDTAAVHHTGGCFFLTSEAVRALGDRTAESLRRLRMEFGGKDFAEVQSAFSESLKQSRLDSESVRADLTGCPLNSLTIANAR